MILTAKSESKLAGVHPDLIAIVRQAFILCPNFIVTDGVRTMARQSELFAMGATRTMNSYHLTGHAVDLCWLEQNGKANWAWSLYQKIDNAMQKSAAELKLQVTWGGNWLHFKDGPHWQIKR